MTGRVTGIGGVFFRAKDPDGLAQWYKDHFGIPIGREGSPDPEWQTEAGGTVFATFEKGEDYFPTDRDFMVNFRVQGLADMLARLEKAGIPSSRNETLDGVGHFAWVYDPEGNPIELWEPIA